MLLDMLGFKKCVCFRSPTDPNAFVPKWPTPLLCEEPVAKLVRVVKNVIVRP